MHNKSSYAFTQFTQVSLTELRKEINSLNTKKSKLENNITPKQLKDHIDISSHFSMK